VTALLPRARRFFEELKRRSVFKVASVYAVVAWGGTLAAADLFPAFGAPDWAVQAFAAAALIGFPVVVVLAWAYEVTAQGVLRDAGAAATAGVGAAPTTALFGQHGVVRVVWRDPRGVEQERLFDSTFAVGREPSCAIRIDDPLVSRQHAEFGQEHGVWYVADLRSRNGTWLDGHRIDRAVLPERAELRLAEGGPTLAIEVRSRVAAETRLAGR
jgi:hypothetical protein